jgi:hypothetical protein
MFFLCIGNALFIVTPGLDPGVQAWIAGSSPAMTDIAALPLDGNTL